MTDREFIAEGKSSNMRQWIWNAFFKDRSAAWTAIFTGVLTFFTYKLYEVARVTDETAKATQRAFVSFAGVGAGVGLSSEDHKTRVAQEILVNWTNSGATPARNAVTNAFGQAWPSDLPIGYNFPTQGNTKQSITLGPKETTNIRAIVSIENFSNTWAGKSHLYVWGWVVYDDVFDSDKPHLTEFCAEMIQITIPTGKGVVDFADPNMPMGWNIARCKEHNCNDGDCKDYSERIKDAQHL